MELGGYGFEKSELIKIAEKIYELKSKKQDLELTLYDEQFHYKYIQKRKNLVEHEVTFRLLWIVPITLAVLLSLVYIIWYVFDIGNVGRVGEAAAAMGVGFLGTTLLTVFGGYAAFKLWKRELHMIMLLWLSKNSEEAAAFSKKHDINTFKNDEATSKQRIAMLEEEISGIETKIKQLEEQQKRLLEDKKRSEDLLRSKGILFDDNPGLLKSNGKFSLREDSMNGADIQELYEYYSSEERYTLNYLHEIDIKLQQINKQITNIDDNFDNVKKIGLYVVCIYILLIILQSVFTGFLETITSVLCIFISVSMVIYVEKKCKTALILYFVEHEHPMIQEYAFCHNMVPVRVRREEILEKMKGLQLELDGIRAKKKTLDL